FNVWFENRKQIYGDEMENWKNQQQADFENWKQQEQNDFVGWVQSLQEVLDESTAGNLLNLINANTNEINQLQTDFTTHQADYTQHIEDETAHGIGDKTTLETSHKSTIVGAINELFTNVSDGKALVGRAITDIDDSVVIPTDPTFNDLASAI